MLTRLSTALQHKSLFVFVLGCSYQLLRVVDARTAHVSRTANTARGASPATLPLSSDSSFNFQTLVLLGEATYGGADIGDVLHAASQVKAGNIESWDKAWHRVASSTQAAAEKLSSQQDHVNVRDTYFAAATYWRGADFYNRANWSDPRIDAYWVKQTHCFNRALAAMDIPGHRVTLPAGGFNVEAIMYTVEPFSPGNVRTRPTLILGEGYDAAQEDMLHFSVYAALARGWNAITYEGPGQPTVRRDQNLGFIPDWERVVTPVVDYLHTRSDVDTSRLALMGLSFGGYLAARAAAFEPRLAAVVLDGGIYSAFDSFFGQLPTSLQALFSSGDRDAFDAAVDSAIAQPDTPTQLKWGIQQGTWSFNIPSPYDFLVATKNYTVRGITDQIRMPVWVVQAEYDQFFQGQPELVAEALGSRATLHRFTDQDGYHAQPGAAEALNREMFSWLTATLDV